MRPLLKGDLSKNLCCFKQEKTKDWSGAWEERKESLFGGLTEALIKDPSFYLD